MPPREVFLHTWMYKTVSTVSSVVHVHPPTVVLFTICNKPLLPLFGAYDPSSLRLVLDGIATYPRSVTVSNDQLGEEFAAAMGGEARLPDARARDHDGGGKRRGSDDHRYQA